ncbi:MAG: hypothetical protein RSB59_04800, partial [Clostridia bacterium]
ALLKDSANTWDVFTNVALSFETVEGNLTVVKTDRELKKADGTPTGAITVGNITGDMKYWVAGVVYLENEDK